jgi:glycosyltransferase involved in cell wall biosynthesis
MRVLIAHTRPGGPVYYRAEEPARAVKEAGLGIDVTLVRGIPTSTRPGPNGEPEVVAVDAGDVDVVVLQLPKTVQMLQTQRLLQARGVAVVVEIDDLLSGVPVGHMGHDSLVRKGLARLVSEAAREADMVTVTTPALLKEYASHGRGAIVPNAIPRRIAELPPAYERTPDTITVGWTGTIVGHPYDLQEMGSGLQDALDRTRGASRFVIFGQKFDARDRLRLRDEPDEIPWLMDIDAYAARIGEVLDVGIAPLQTNRFNEAKSWLKPLEYAARGIFCVRARTSEYERLGLGLPAKAPKDWTKWLLLGIQDADRRREMAAAAREKVLASHLTEHSTEQWVAAWRAALEHRARTRPRATAVNG